MNTSNTKNYPLLMCVITALLWFSVYTYVPILTPYTEGLGASYTLIGIIVSSYGFVQLVMRIPIGMLSDMMGKRKIFIFFGLLCSALSSIGLYFFDAPYLVLIFRGLSGLAVSTWAIFITTYSSLSSGQNHMKGMGIINGMNSLGQLTGLLAGGFIAYFLSYEATFIFGGVGAIVALLLSLYLPDIKPESKSGVTFKKIFSLIHNTDLVFYSVLAVILQLVLYSGSFGFLSTILKNMGVNAIVLGIAPAATALPSIFSSYFAGTFFKEKLGVKKIIIYSFILLAISVFFTVNTTSLMLIMAMQLLCGFARGLLLPTLTSMATAKVSTELRSSATSFFQSVYSVGMTLGPIIIGFFADTYGMLIGFNIVISFCIIGALSMYFKKLS